MKKLLSTEEETLVVEAIRSVERRSSGEVRVFIEEFCADEALVRAHHLFLKNGMHHTKYRNGVLIYLAWGTRELAIWGDEGNHQKVGPEFWKLECDIMRQHFREKRFGEGLSRVINQVGEQLETHFPHEPGDKNELPDEIIYG